MELPPSSVEPVRPRHRQHWQRQAGGGAYDPGAIASVRFAPRRCGMEVPCPRASPAAMIAASLFG